jgi:hypothetical protein
VPPPPYGGGGFSLNRKVVMSPEPFLDLLDADPFRPFRLHLDDGHALDVKHPALVLVELGGWAYVGRGKPSWAPRGHARECQHVAMISLAHVTRFEFLTPDPDKGTPP